MTEKNNPLELTPQQKKLLLAREKMTDQISPELGFVCRTMVAASMPHSKVKGIQYSRKTHKFILTITSTEDSMIPYGTYPRLILSWLISEVVKTKSREIELGDSLSHFMHKIGLSVTGGQRGTVNRFKEQLKFLFSASISFQYEDKGEWFIANMHIADKAHLFWENDNQTPNKENLFKSKVTIGETFFEEIIKAPVPVDITAISALKDSSLALDIYFWLTYRLSYMGKITSIPFEKLQLQFGAGYQDTPHGRYEFKRKFIIQLKKVLFLYPQAKVKIEEDSILLIPSASHIKKTTKTNVLAK